MEARFVAEYMVDMCQAFAMERADGSGKKKNWRQLGYQMMQKPHVKAAVEKRVKAIAEKLDITAQSVLWDIHRIALKAEGTGDYSAALKGRELLGKYLKLFTEKHEHGGIGGGPVQLSITPQDAAL